MAAPSESVWSMLQTSEIAAGVRILDTGIME
ncbi:hypothetical protein BJQ97_03024 [Geobacillus sp. TFV-3]|nr:hypothetical protein BJQ97_03024 [Geobacillus sp. TFV-3]